MNITKLKALLTAIDLGSFSRAAEQLGYTQSGLTHMMKSIEAEFGFEIVSRGYYGVRPTENGEKILPKIRRLVALDAEIHEDVRLLRERGDSLIKVGAYSSVALHWLPSIVQLFSNEYPGVDVQISTGSVSELYDGINSERFDLAFVSYNNRFPSEFIHLKDDRMMAILPMDYPTDITQPFPLSGYEGKNFLMPSLGFDIDIMNIFNKAGISPNVVSTFVDDPAIISMVEHGLGISMLSELIVRGRSGNVLCLPIEPYVCRDIGIALSPKKKPNDVVRRFIRFSQKFAENFNMRG